MPIVPDDKDWTWVLEKPCPECGFDATAMDCTDVAELLRSSAMKWHTLLTVRNDVRERPNADVWSPLEYAAA